MENNLNHKVINTYSRDFAEKVCASYFSGNERVGNDQLMEVQPVRQVNLFVVKNLFDAWQKEAENLRSPYFDYNAPKVQEAMERLRNILSRHIQLDRETYQPLLEKATAETLRLILSPYDYYKELISIDESLLTTDYLKATSKYLKVNPFIITELITRLEKEKVTNLTREKALELLDSVVDEHDGEPDDVEPHIREFGKIHPVTLEELYGGSEKKKSPARQADNDSGMNNNKPENVRPSREKSPSGSDSAETEKRTLHDNLFNKEQSTLADIHQKQKIQDIRKHLTINQRFMFVNSLFEGNAERFNEVIDHIERQDSVDEAIHYLHAAFSEWDREGEEAQEFYSIVRRRLS